MFLHSCNSNRIGCKRPGHEQALLGCWGKLGRLALEPNGILCQFSYKDVYWNQGSIQHHFQVIATTLCLVGNWLSSSIFLQVGNPSTKGKGFHLSASQDYWPVLIFSAKLQWASLRSTRWLYVGNSVHPQVQQSGTGCNKDQVMDGSNKPFNRVAQGYRS